MESDHGPLSYQDSVLPLNYTRVVWHYYTKFLLFLKLFFVARLPYLARLHGIDYFVHLALHDTFYI